MIGNGVVFPGPERSHDPWYRVSNITAGLMTSNLRNGSLPTYRPEEAASPLGCVEQFQFCRSSDQKCGPLAAWLDAVFGAAHLFDLTPDEVMTGDVGDPTHTAISSRFMWYLSIMNYVSKTASQIPNYAGSRRLLSEQSMESGIQFGLRDDQWQHDVTHWWSTWMALQQISFLDVAKGPPPSFPADSIARPTDKHHTDMCNNQVCWIITTPA